jgi:hypothetical protein
MDLVITKDEERARTWHARSCFSYVGTSTMIARSSKILEFSQLLRARLIRLTMVFDADRWRCNSSFISQIVFTVPTHTQK